MPTNPKPAGRPKRPGGAKYTQRIDLRVTEAQARKITREAKKRGMFQVEYLRMLIDEA